MHLKLGQSSRVFEAAIYSQRTPTDSNEMIQFVKLIKK